MYVEELGFTELADEQYKIDTMHRKTSQDAWYNYKNDIRPVGTKISSVSYFKIDDDMYIGTVDIEYVCNGHYLYPHVLEETSKVDLYLSHEGYEQYEKPDVIELKEPYSSIWKLGYLVEGYGRKNVLLVNSDKDRSTTSYARYLMSVHLGRLLHKNEHVDHINKDKYDDRIENLQILT